MNKLKRRFFRITRKIYIFKNDYMKKRQRKICYTELLVSSMVAAHTCPGLQQTEAGPESHGHFVHHGVFIGAKPPTVGPVRVSRGQCQYVFYTYLKGWRISSSALLVDGEERMTAGT